MRLAAAFLAAALAGAQEGRQAPVRLVVGEKVPDFVVNGLDGKPLRLADLQKKSKTGVVTLTFWCTICTSCRVIDGAMEKLHQATKDRAAFFALDCGDTVAKVVEFNKQKGLTFPVVMNDAKAPVNALFGVNATTTTLVIDGKGVLQYFGRFSDPRANVAYTEDALKAVLAGEPVAVKRTSPVG